MHPILKNIIAVIVGIFIGGAINMSIIMLSPHIIPPPDGSNFTTEEGLKASMHLMQPKHFIFPFLAHALGTFAGAFLAAKIAANKKMIFAIAVGVAFLIGGVQMVFLLPSPMWFNTIDLTLAYIPMALMAAYLAIKKQ